MKLIDISRGVLTSPVFPGDPKPILSPVSLMENGEECDVSALFACVHTGTHADAPSHYLAGAAAAEKLPLENFIGECTVVTTGGIVTGAEMEEIVENSKPRLLLRSKGFARLTDSAAHVIIDSGIKLIGTDALSISDEKNDRTVHTLLLKNGVGILEALMLDGVYDGDYFLIAPPVKIEGSDGAFVRAVLMVQ